MMPFKTSPNSVAAACATISNVDLDRNVVVRKYEGAFPSQPVATPSACPAPTPIFSSRSSPTSTDNHYVLQRQDSMVAAAAQRPAAQQAGGNTHQSQPNTFRAPSKLLPPSGDLVYVRQQHSPDAVLAVPATCIAHMPRGVDASRLFLCQWSAGQEGWQACPHGTNCPFVHADLGKAVVCSTVHEVNSSWRCLGDVHYERAEPGATLSVNLPNTRKNAPTQSIPRECFLVTRCLAGNRRPVSHCAHFFTKGICHRGAQCCFAHVVFLPMEVTAPVAPDATAPTIPMAEEKQAAAPAPAVRRNDPYGPHQQTTLVVASESADSRPSRPFQHRPYDARPLVVC